MKTMTLNDLGNSTKEQVYRELCEMGKLGIDIKHPRVFQKLEKTNLDQYKNMSISAIADLMIEVTS